MLFKGGKRLDKLFNTIKSFTGKLIVKQIAIGITFTVLLFVIVMLNIAPEKISVSIGDSAPYDIRATKDIINERATERLRQEAIDKVEPRYLVDRSIQVKVKNEMKRFFELVYNMKDYNDNTGYETLFIEQDIGFDVTKDEFIKLVKTDIEGLNNLEEYIYDIVDQIMPTGVTDKELEYEKQNVVKIFNTLDDLSDLQKKLGAQIVNNGIQPNRFLDVETTEEKRQEAAGEVKPVIIKDGQIIVREGELITLEIRNLIKETGLLKEKEGIDFKVVVGSLLIVLLLGSVIIAYLYILNQNILKDPKQLTILTIVILSVIIISKSMHNISEYLLPVASATMLISILVDARLSILINFIMSMLIALITGSGTEIIAMCIIGGTVGAIGASKTSHRQNVFLTGLIVGLINVLTILAFSLIGDIVPKSILIKSVYGILNGVFSGIITIGSLPLWEGVFRVVTPLKLLELSNPNHPLLKRLLLEAPGTYHHSVIVGNLSESAAEAVGANTLVARAGAYFHDVGKLKRPYFFKENQLSGPNPHDKINPSLSTLIITSHIKDGIDLAKKYKLPLVIQDIINQHHGDTLVAYFYHKAMNGENPDLIQEESFRYKGPKPQSKESAIIMLADSVEAAVRSIQDPTKGKIEGLVRKIISDKLSDDQLNECHLTLKDLDTIANAFLNVLLGIFHERIEYPNVDINELKGAN